MEQKQAFVERLTDIIPTLKAKNILSSIEDTKGNYGFKLRIERSNRRKQQNINALIDNVDEIGRRLVLEKDNQYFTSLTQQREINIKEENKKEAKTDENIEDKHQRLLKFYSTMRNSFNQWPIQN